jgi:hypothetical protein
MMNNLIGNAVESVGGSKGVKVEVSYEVKGEEVEIRVRDNGEGMPREMVEKINRGEAVRSTKEEGHGIGMEQIIKTIREMKGKMEVKSKEGEGTEFVLRFKRSEKPEWFADKIEIKTGDTVVVLDDEVLIHEVLKRRFKEYENELTFKYFSKGMEAIEFINRMGDKRKVFLIADYELKGEEINGIEVIEKSGMKDRHILMTNKDISDIKEFKEKSKFIKIFHKMYVNDINIVVV